MNIRIWPNRADLAKYPKSLKWIGLTLLIVLPLLLIIGISFIQVPAIIDGVVDNILSFQVRHDWFFIYTVKDAIVEKYKAHYEAVLALSDQSRIRTLEKDDLEIAAQLPGVLDVFWLSFKEETCVCWNGIVSSNELFQRLNPTDLKRSDKSVKPERFIPKFGTLRYRIGCRRLQIGDRDYVLLVKYLGETYPAMADGVIGIILDRNHVVEGIPALLDSLVTKTTYFANMNDTVGGFFSFQTRGLVDGNDTIWWEGDRRTVIKKYVYDLSKNETEGTISEIEGLDLKLLVKTALPDWQQLSVRMARAIPKMIRLIEIIFVTAIGVLGFNIFLAVRRGRTNQIALAHLAHAVKTPVARLRLAADTLTEGRVASPDEERTMLNAVTRECDRLDRAVKNATLSLQKGKLEFNLQVGDIALLLKEVTDSWKPSFDNLGIELELLSPESLTTKFDRELIPVMLDNLIDNALRHSRLSRKDGQAVPTGPQDDGAEIGRSGRPVPLGSSDLETIPSVTISLHSDSKYIILSIDDSGPGIPKSERKRLFQPFTGRGRDPKTGATGLGLGLHLAKRIATGHGGSIAVGDSGLGGASFTVKLLRTG